LTKRRYHGNDNGTDGQTDRQSATQYAAPSYGGGPHNKHVVWLTASSTSSDNAEVTDPTLSLTASRALCVVCHCFPLVTVLTRRFLSHRVFRL